MFGLLNPLMLAGLAVLAVPPLLHLLNRRRCEVVDWGAMRFLRQSTASRRRVFFEDLLLLLLRMGLLALLVLALAAPFVAGGVADRLGMGEERDLVLVVDGSAAMSVRDDQGRTARDAAAERAEQLLDALSPGDGVGLVLAREKPVPLVDLTTDAAAVRERLRRLPPPAGVADWPAAVDAARRVLRRGGHARRDLVLISDGRRDGWADADTLDRWKLLAAPLRADRPRPRLWALAVGPPHAGPPPSWGVAPLATDPTSARAAVTVHAALTVSGRPEGQPYRVVRLVDAPPGTPRVESGPARNAWALDRGEGTTDLPAFRQEFDGPGGHLLSVVVEPEAPGAAPPPRDRVGADDRRDVAVLFRPLPVLLVDGLAPDGKPEEGSRPLYNVLAGDGRASWMVRPRTATPGGLADALSAAGASGLRPRVLVLCDVPRLGDEQAAAVDRFVRGGGGVLVTVGPRTDREAFNRLYRGGDGWLPARLEEAVGDANEPAPPVSDSADPRPAEERDRAAHPRPSSLNHPALRPFKRADFLGLGQMRLPRRWRLAAPEVGVATAGGSLTDDTPFLIERRHGRGRVLLCAAPLTAAWGGNALSLPDFPVLAFELVAYLAGRTEVNVEPGQPLVYEPLDDEDAGHAELRTPDGATHALDGKDGVFTWPDTLISGVYVLTTSRRRPVYFVVQPDAHVPDATTATAEERRAAEEAVGGLEEVGEVRPILAGPDRDVWWLFLLGVVALLCAEVWWTRRIVRSR